MLRVCAQHRAAILEHTEIVDLCGISMHLITENTPLWSCTKMSESPFPMPYWGFCWPGSYALTRFIQENPEVVRGKRVLDFAAGCSIAGIASSQCGALSVVCNDIDEWSCIASQMNADININTYKSCPIQIEVANLVGSLHHDFGTRTGFGAGGEPWLPHDTCVAHPTPELDFVPLQAPTVATRSLADVDVVLAGDVCYDDVLARQVSEWLSRLAAGGGGEAEEGRGDKDKGKVVLLGDPGRYFLPRSLPDERSSKCENGDSSSDNGIRIAKVAAYDLPPLVKDGNNGLPEGFVWEVLPHL